jgi:hydrogenase maturation protease
MNRPLLDKIVAAVLYEGYILYPYRPSVKNRQRWTFGGLYPEVYCQGQKGADASFCQAEVLVEGDADTVLEVGVRFLHLTNRTVGALNAPVADWPGEAAAPTFRIVDSLDVGGTTLQPWQEAEEREISGGRVTLADLMHGAQPRPFTVAGRRWLEPVYDAGGEVCAVLARAQQPLDGVVSIRAREVDCGVFRISARVENQTPFDGVAVDRDGALLRSLVSTHVLLGVERGALVSLFDPPDEWRDAAAECRNVGVWPVLVGEDGDRDTMLASPIILYDYPRIAPESPGDLFDGTEIDEILTLRILTLTDQEKRQAVVLDDKARALLARTEALAREQLLGLHGTVRGLRPVSEE